jgi:hypothetical protein
VPWALVFVLAVGCGAARQRRTEEEYLRTELNFVVPYVDLDAEESATRRVLAQRNLVVDDEARGDNFRALAASSLDGKRTAVRIITQRGVVAAADADADDWFALRRVKLSWLASRGTLPETLVGISRTARGQDVGCLELFRVQPDGRLGTVEMHVERFGTQACVSALLPVEKGNFDATVSWPGLSAGRAPALLVQLEVEAALLNAPPSPNLVLRVSEPSRWSEAAVAQLAALEPRTFADRQARAVAEAALALAQNQGVAQQVGAYRSALSGAAPHSAEAETMAATVAHIERGWSDEEPQAPEDEQDATRIEPPSQPDPAVQAPPTADDVVIEPQRR